MPSSHPEKLSTHKYAVIMAGGSGTRLWPLSRRKKPKQFQRFISSQTMIQETFARVAKVVPIENIFVSTTKAYQELTLEQLPEITADRLILEPKSRNTAPAIAFVAATLTARDPEAIVATIASDHAIDNPGEFVLALEAALQTIAQSPDKLVTVGINPTRPDTGLGYIKMGKEFQVIGEKRVFFVDAFKEKPDQKTAEQYLASWEYLWNAGYFIFSAQTFLGWVKQQMPELDRVMIEIMNHRQAGTLDEKTLEDLYAQAPSEAVEPAIIEKLTSTERLVIPSFLKWSDVGSWGTLYDFLKEKVGTQLVTRGNHLDIDSRDTLVFGDGRLITTLGVENLVIIDTEDALLVARRDRISGDIKKLIEKLKTEGKEWYL